MPGAATTAALPAAVAAAAVAACPLARASKPAASALGGVARAVAAGVAAKALLRAPHLTLVERASYDAVVANDAPSLRAALVEWAVVGLRTLGDGALTRGVDDATARGYVTRGARSSAATRAAVARLADASVQALNLAHAWIDIIMPHVLSKVREMVTRALSPRQTARRCADAHDARSHRGIFSIHTYADRVAHAHGGRITSFVRSQTEGSGRDHTRRARRCAAFSQFRELRAP